MQEINPECPKCGSPIHMSLEKHCLIIWCDCLYAYPRIIALPEAPRVIITKPDDK